MPKYNVTQAYGAPIPVQAGDIVQNTGIQTILVCPGSAPTDDDAAEVPPGRGLSISAAETVSVRCASRHGSSVKIIRGM